MHPDSRVLITGADHHLGRAIVAALKRQGFANIVGDHLASVNLHDGAAVRAWFAVERPEYVFHAAGKCGGIAANQRYPATLMLDNLLVNSHVLEAARASSVRKLLYLASSCCYPRNCPQPMGIEHLGSGPLEPTNEAYATAKLAGITLCHAYRREFGVDFVSAIPTNHFGPGDDFSPQDSHVVAALLVKMHEAKCSGLARVELWGTGAARREFLYDDDLAEAAIFVMKNYSNDNPINLGGGATVSIRELAELIRAVVGYEGQIDFDASKPDGMPVKMLDSSPLTALGWRPVWELRRAIAETYRWFVTHLHSNSLDQDCTPSSEPDRS